MVVPTLDTLPRVPDAHGDVVDEKLYSDLYIRTSWVDAAVALNQIEKVNLIIYILRLKEEFKFLNSIFLILFKINVCVVLFFLSKKNNTGCSL